MSFIANIFKTLLLERPSRKKSYTDYATIFETKGSAIQDKVNGAANSEKNRKILSHIIGIARWGQSRVRVALGDPFVDEDYMDRHRPSKETGWSELKTQFAETRAASVALAKELSAENVSTDTTVRHNDLGEVSVRGWLHYMQFHASTEARAIK